MPWTTALKRAAWFIYGILDFAENVEPYELEDFLSQILDNEFETVVDDGSLNQVSFLPHILLSG